MMTTDNLLYNCAVFLFLVIALVLIVNAWNLFREKKNSDDDFTHWL
ncbi:hypothetical protein [Pedobacter sp. L105]|nr:hypothetical protein [Pedobacter sp. L105]